MRKHSRKIFYSPGLISIILLPIMCILFLKSRDAFTQYGSITLATWDGKIFYNEITTFLNSKKFTKVTLTGDYDSDKIKLINSKKEIQRLISTKDSINGIQFHFDEKSKYWSYVKVVEILQDENAQFYVPYKNDIWFTNPKLPKKETKTFVCGNTVNMICVSEKPNFNLDIIQNIVKKYYLIIIIYLLMVYFTIRKIYSLNKGIR
ncbi:MULTISPECIES: hypothetical protein [Flavobacterium]|uniref:hypothetical protein n=1 Tax=Flavobacterium TaxID=237 RepID=UPI001FCC8C4D|nr:MULTISPECIES: hypothetical protein [Flavobacterium]UOK42154.1 hypothetical protein LZF87_12650 [Flavobacterium enshiense]